MLYQQSLTVHTGMVANDNHQHFHIRQLREATNESCFLITFSHTPGKELKRERLRFFIHLFSSSLAHR